MHIQCMAGAERAVEDIMRVLALTFRGRPEGLESADVARSWSLDWQWLAPHEADVAVKQMLQSKWLIESEEGVSPGVDISNISAPLGWFPRPSHLMHPPLHRGSAPVVEAVMADIPHVEETPQTGPAGRISDSSGIPVEEIERRAIRKKRALGCVEEWLCLALVAREQGLDLEPLIPVLRP